MKINQAGVIPAIFASSLLLFPASASTWFGQGEGFEWLQEIALALGPGQPLYVILISCLIALFCFFYTYFVFLFSLKMFKQKNKMSFMKKLIYLEMY